MNRTRVSTAIGFALLVPACFPKAAALPAPVTAADVSAAMGRWPDATEGSLAAGRVLFVDHCAKCHAYPAVHAVPDEKWPQVMHSMAKKSHLGPDDEQKMLRFVLTAGARSGT